MNQRLLIFVMLALSTPLWAHEHWLIMESENHSIDHPVTVKIFSGHALGENEFLMESQLIREVKLRAPDGQVHGLPFKVMGDQYQAQFVPDQPGEYQLYVNLRKRAKGPFIYLMQTSITIGPQPQHQETFPDEDLYIFKVHGEQRLGVMAKGQQVMAGIELLKPDGHTESLIMDKSGFCSIDALPPGQYAAFTHYRRQTCSTTFEIGR